MMIGKPQSLISKFKISFNLLLNLIDTGEKNALMNFTQKSMIKEDIDRQLERINYKILDLQKMLNSFEECIKHFKTPINVINQYLDLSKKISNSVNKKKKEYLKEYTNIFDNNKFIELEKLTIIKYNEKLTEFNETQKEYENVTNYIDNNILIIIDIMEKDNFIIKDDETNYILTQKGILATQLRETHCLIFTNLFDSKALDDLTSKQLVAIFSCFTNISVQEDLKSSIPRSDDKIVQNMMIKIQEMYIDYQQKEIMNRANTGADYNIHFDLLDYVVKWCDCVCIEDCKFFLQTLEKEKEIFLGEFVKALLKITNISSELEKVAELSGNIQFLSKLKEIPTMILKFVVTNQSLYV